jgi:uncharacterized membrane protein YoaK (UPF0700 family)
MGGSTARSHGWRAAILALFSGYVDSYCLLNYGVYASFMSGNTTQAGAHAGLGKLVQAAPSLLPIPLFVAGIFVGTLLVRANPRYASRRQIELVAVLWAIGTASAYLRSAAWFSIAILGFAMGVMNTTITRVGGQPVSLGFVTGDLNSLAQHLALGVRREPVLQAQGAWDTHWRRATLLAGIWSAFLAGAVSGAFTMHRIGVWTLLLPFVLMLALAAWDRTRGASHVCPATKE